MLTQILHKPALDYLKSLKANCIDFIYIDPPFYTQKKQSLQANSYDDIWLTLSDYTVFMRDHLVQAKRVLKPHGSIMIHLDWHASHYIKQQLDQVFGYDHFINEIIWHYTGGGRSKKRFSHKHDVLFWYAKGDQWTFNIDAIRVPYKSTSSYAKSGIKGKNGKTYMPNDLGTPLDDTWDIPIINPLSHERVDYPTQKPLALLERIIAACTNKGDLVLDFFAGSGTTGHACYNLQRHCILVDSNQQAINVMQARFDALYNYSPVNYTGENL